jgi:hypothetical protein
MHLIENYALAAGCKIGTPHIEPLFYPIEHDKYITIHGGSGMDSKNYSYFENVIKLIKPKLKEQGIKILQIGEKKDESIKGAESLLGETSLRQSFFVLKNSMLHLGNDSFSTHVSAFYETPVVALYGPVITNTCSPYWGDKNTQSLISPDYSSRKPSFATKEVTKRVDEIFPDHVASECLRLLNIDNNLSENKPIHIGSNFHTQIIDIVPDSEPPKTIQIKEGSMINIRADYTDNPYMTEYWVRKHKCAIYLNKEIELKLIEENKNNIKIIYLFISDETPEDYINKIISTGVKLKLLYIGEDISSIRLKFFHQNIYKDQELSKKDLDNPDNLCHNYTYYESSLNIIRGDKIYPSKAAMDLELEKQCNTTFLQKIIDNRSFYQEIDYFKIYKNDKDKKD